MGTTICDTIAPKVVHPDAKSGLLLVCEHASNHIPAALGDLGLTEAQRHLHIAWDPGAADVARALSATLDATLIEARVSRLVYDCNRAPEAPDAIPDLSEVHLIPGNQGLSAAERAERIETYYRPFEACLAQAVSPGLRALVTVHSFTPVYRGAQRPVEIGLLHGRDPGLAQAMLASPLAPRFELRLNEPYSAADGVAHTLDLHANRHGIANVMLEIRNDLIADAAAQAAMAATLAPWIAAVTAEVSP